MRVTRSSSARVRHTAELCGTSDSQLGSFLAPLRGALVLDAVFVSVCSAMTHCFVIAAFAVATSMYNHEPLSLVSVALCDEAFVCSLSPRALQFQLLHYVVSVYLVLSQKQETYLKQLK